MLIARNDGVSHKLLACLTLPITIYAYFLKLALYVISQL